jgi:hypothetical protein
MKLKEQSLSFATSTRVDSARVAKAVRSGPHPGEIELMRYDTEGSNQHPTSRYRGGRRCNRIAITECPPG